MIEILDPTVGPTVHHKDAPAPVATVHGKTVGLVSNGKLNATELLDIIGELLRSEHGAKVCVRSAYHASEIMTDDEWSGLDGCDFVVLATGDCGACSSSGIVNTIAAEQRYSVPAVLIVTTPFVEACRSMASLSGRPNLRWALVDHPIGNVDEATLRDRAAKAVPQIVDIVRGITAPTQDKELQPIGD